MPPKYPGKKFSFSAYDKKHLQNLVKQALKMDKIFKDAIQQGTQIGASTGFCDPNGEFLFDKFPAIKQRAEDLFTGMHDEIMLTITNGNREEWLLSAAKNNAMVDAYYKKAAKQFGQQAEEWTDRHMKALEQFNERVERGMNLSDRVWNLTTQFKQELELALEIGLGEGKSAAALTKDVRQYLNEPNKLFRRVRDEKGVLRLSKAAQAYHPGRGVYRSSYKNALRLTATENNMAYRTSDYERWQDMDFVTGMDIKLSNNHTLNGKPFVDICDHLQGKYPKDFKFVGWHPFCRCIAVPRLADEDEFIARQQALIDGENPADEPYGGEVTELPDNFQNWVEENAEKIETAKSVPYFVSDNRAAVNNIINPAMTPQEIADQRHAQRSQAEIDDIKNRWEQKLARDRKTMSDANRVLAVAKTYGEVDYSEIEKLIAEKNLNALPQATQDLLNATKAMRAQEKALSDLIPDVHDWHKQFTLAELKEAHGGIVGTLDYWKTNFGADLATDSNLEKLQDELKKKIKFVENPGAFKPGAVQKKTWQVSQEAYNNLLNQVENRIEFKALETKYNDLHNYYYLTKSTDFKHYMDNALGYLQAGDNKKAKTWLNIAEGKKNALEAAKAKRKGAKASKTTSDQFGNDAYTQKRKDAAMWAKDTKEADDRLRDTCGDVWRKASKKEQDAIYGYTRSYNNINEPLRGLTYYGTAEKKKEGLDRIPLIEAVIDRSSYNFDMWLQRGDGMVALKKFGLSNWETATDKEIMGLLGAEGVEGAFWSAGVAKGKGFSGSIIFNIYAPKGTKAMYCEPFSAYGHGSGRSWDGKSKQRDFGYESEILIQRGTKYKITKIEKSGGTWYIDVDIIEQKPVAFPYKGGYPFK